MGKEFLDAMEIQRRNFERQFGSLSSLGFEDKTQVDEDSSENEDSEQDEDSNENDTENGGNKHNGNGDSSDSDTDSDSDSDGFNEDDQFSSQTIRQQPKVVRIGGGPEQNFVQKKDKNLARSGRAPTIKELNDKEDRINKLTKKQKLKAAAEDAENLDNDLKLQRLLSESHILAHNMDNSGADLTLQTLDYDAPIGNARRRILDHRIRTVLAVNSNTDGKPRKLEKMPMHMRKGMIKARDRRVAEYEREARDAGIVLSKVKKGETRVLDQGRGVTLASDRIGSGNKQAKRIRDRGLRINSVGKLTRNGLRISQDEIDRVNNQGKKRKRK